MTVIEYPITVTLAAAFEKSVVDLKRVVDIAERTEAKVNEACNELKDLKTSVEGMFELMESAEFPEHGDRHRLSIKQALRDVFEQIDLIQKKVERNEGVVSDDHEVGRIVDHHFFNAFILYRITSYYIISYQIITI